MKLLRFLLIPIVINLLMSLSAYSHEVRPAYLEIKETAKNTYSIFWKVPAILDQRLAIHPQFPNHCKFATKPSMATTDGAYIEQGKLQCDGGLAGRQIYIDGLSSTLTDVLIRFIHLDQTIQTSRLTRMSPSVVIDAVPGNLDVSLTYFLLGIEHILFGFDHLLFVLALMMLVKDLRRLIITITAFTLAHSITLAAATLGFVTVPGPPIEAMIALSIVFVAGEILSPHQRNDLSANWPWLMAFLFGLLHGFGFAGALHDIGLPQNAVPFALLFFNIGVEVGQLIFIAVVVTLMTLLKPMFFVHQKIIFRSTAYVIGSLAGFWLIERVVGFFN